MIYLTILILMPIMGHVNAADCKFKRYHTCLTNNEKVAVINGKVQYECQDNLVCNAAMYVENDGETCEPCIEAKLGCTKLHQCHPTDNTKFEFTDKKGVPLSNYFKCPPLTECNDSDKSCQICIPAKCPYEWTCNGNTVILVNENVQGECRPGTTCNTEKIGCDPCISQYGGVIFPNSAATNVLSWCAFLGATFAYAALRGQH